MSKTRVRVWFKQFCEEQRQSVMDNKHPGRRRTSRSADNIQAVAQALLGDRRKTVRMLLDEIGLPKSSVHNILKKTSPCPRLRPSWF